MRDEGILIRYGCDGCYKWTIEKDDFHAVRVSPFNSRGNFQDRVGLYCDECFEEREESTRKRGGLSYADETYRPPLANGTKNGA